VPHTRPCPQARVPWVVRIFTVVLVAALEPRGPFQYRRDAKPARSPSQDSICTLILYPYFIDIIEKILI
jgi:hypothetical protein